MQLILDTNLSYNEKKETIDNYLQKMGLILFQNCKHIETVPENLKSKITASLCISYLKNLYQDYLSITIDQFKQSNMGSKVLFSFSLNENHISDIAEITKNIYKDSEDISER